MMEEVGAFPHNLANSRRSSTATCCTSQHRQRPGRKPRQHPVAEGAGDHRDRPHDRQAGVGRQLASAIKHPARPVVDAGGRRRSAACVQVVHAQGDGWVRGYEAKTGKKLWEFDTNPKDSVWPKTRNEVIAHAGDLRERRLHRERPGSRARRRRRPRSTRSTRPSAATSPQTGRIWHFDKIRRSISTAAIKDGLIYLAGLQRLPALPRRQDRQAALDARHVRRDLGLADGRRRQGLPRRRGRRRRRDRSTAETMKLARGERTWAAPSTRRSVPANGVLFVMNRNQLYAIQRRRAAEEVRRGASALECMMRRDFVLRPLRSRRARRAASRPARSRRPPTRGRSSAARRR